MTTATQNAINTVIEIISIISKSDSELAIQDTMDIIDAGDETLQAVMNVQAILVNN